MGNKPSGSKAKKGSNKKIPGQTSDITDLAASGPSLSPRKAVAISPLKYVPPETQRHDLTDAIPPIILMKILSFIENPEERYNLLFLSRGFSKAMKNLVLGNRFYVELTTLKEENDASENNFVAQCGSQAFQFPEMPKANIIEFMTVGSDGALDMSYPFGHKLLVNSLVQKRTIYKTENYKAEIYFPNLVNLQRFKAFYRVISPMFCRDIKSGEVFLMDRIEKNFVINRVNAIYSCPHPYISKIKGIYREHPDWIAVKEKGEEYHLSEVYDYFNSERKIVKLIKDIIEVFIHLKKFGILLTHIDLSHLFFDGKSEIDSLTLKLRLATCPTKNEEPDRMVHKHPFFGFYTPFKENSAYFIGVLVHFLLFGVYPYNLKSDWTVMVHSASKNFRVKEEYRKAATKSAIPFLETLLSDNVLNIEDVLKERWMTIFDGERGDKMKDEIDKKVTTSLKNFFELKKKDMKIPVV